MPSVVVGPKRNNSISILHRSESLRSEVSDASIQSKKVSFNNDVRIRRIPRGGIVHGQLVAVLDQNGTNRGGGSSSGCLWINSNLATDSGSLIVEKDLLNEAETILRNVDNIYCESSPSYEPIPQFRRLERSKSELLIPLNRKSEVSFGSIGDLREFSEPELIKKPSNHSYKVLRIKKPSRRRIGLDSFGESSFSSGSGSDSNNKSSDNSSKNLEEFLQFSSESPLSSLSSDNNMSNQRYESSPRVSTGINKQTFSKKEHQSPLLRSSFLETSHGNTHNNNQPFSYTRGRSSPDALTNGNGKKSREIIYAQVVSGERRNKDGTPEKRTVHKKYSDLTNTTTSSESPDYQKHIRHFVYDKENWKGMNGSGVRDSSELLSTYKTRNNSQYGSKNNVTTVLLNSNDEEDSLRSTTITNNDLFITNRSSSSPPRLTERPFFYGDSRHAHLKTFDHSSSSSPQFQYSSDSREQSPTAISAAKLVREAEKRKETVIHSPKIVTNYSSNLKNHTNYNYMTEKLGYLTPSEYSVDVRRPPPRPEKRERSVSMERKPARYEAKTIVNGSSKTGFGTNVTHSSEYKRSNYNKNNFNTSYSTTMEKNRKNSQESETLGKRRTNTLGSKPPSSGGLISTLMRRNKDKKIKDQPLNQPETKVKTKNKFLSLFFDNKNSVTKKSDKLNNQKGSSKSKQIVTDSEIDDAERKRDGEYHSWSSVDGSYRLDKGDGRQKERITRGKSYNFGDYRKNTGDRWYYNGDNTPEDYRRDLATTHYKSATLGRPIMRSSTDRNNGDSMVSRTKSLDRRTLRTNRLEPPKIVITPNSPPVDETGYNWGSYQGTTKQKLGHKLSKSSVELDSHYGPYENGRTEVSPSRTKVSEKLRYFGDTDVESLANQRAGRHSRFSSPVTQDQGYHVQNGNHVSRRDTLLRRVGKNDGIQSSEDSESRLSNLGSTGSRSVFLHAPTVAEIPSPMGLQRRTLSKDEISNYSGPQKQTRHLARSMSVLAPWRPRSHRDKYELNYSEDGNNDSKYRRPPKPPRSLNQKSGSPVLKAKRRSESTENLLEEPSSSQRSSTKFPTAASVKRSKSMSNDTSSFANWLAKRKEGSRK